MLPQKGAKICLNLIYFLTNGGPWPKTPPEYATDDLVKHVTVYVFSSLVYFAIRFRNFYSLIYFDFDFYVIYVSTFDFSADNV